VPGTEGGAYVVQWITEEEYEHLVDGADVLIRAAANAAIWASAPNHRLRKQDGRAFREALSK
jgi:hypothetical protein